MRTALVAAVAFALGVLSRPTLGTAYRALRPQPPAASPASPDPAPRELHRHAAFLRQIERGPKVVPVVLLGDSITECWSLSPDLMADTFGPGCLNLGVGGDRTADVLWRASNGELDGYRAAVVVACVGTNDLHGGVSPEAVAAGVKRLVAEIRSRQPAARVVVLAIPPRGAGPGEPLRKAVAEANRLIAAGLPGEFADVGGSLVEADGTILQSVMPDAVHPSPEGYRRWGAEIKPLRRR